MDVRGFHRVSDGVNRRAAALRLPRLKSMKRAGPLNAIVWRRNVGTFFTLPLPKLARSPLLAAWVAPSLFGRDAHTRLDVGERNAAEELMPWRWPPRMLAALMAGVMRRGGLHYSDSR